MDPISRTMKTEIKKNNYLPQHPRSFTTAITSANPSVSAKLKRKKTTYVGYKVDQLSRYYHFNDIEYALMDQGELS